MAETTATSSGHCPASSSGGSDSEEVVVLSRRKTSSGTVLSAAAGGAASRASAAGRRRKASPNSTHPASDSSALPSSSSRRGSDDDDELDDSAESETGEEVASSAAKYEDEVPRLLPIAVYSWTPPEGAPSLAKLVEQREVIFAKQRAFDKAHLQQRFHPLLAAKLSSFRRNASGVSMYGAQLRSYASFCRSVSIPPWPMTDILCALYLFGAVSGTRRATSRRAPVTALCSMTRWFEPLSHVVPGYQGMADWPGGKAAIEEWQKLAPEEEDVAASKRSSHSRSAKDRQATPDSDDCSQSEDEGEPDAAQARPLVKRTPASKVHQLPCPGMPQIGDTFASSTHLFKAVIKALVPVYGVSAGNVNGQSIRGNRYKEKQGGCPFRVNFSSQNTVTSSSVFIHSHGSEPTLAVDPNWRPYLRNKDAIEALDELARERAPKTKPKATSKGKRSAPRAKPSSRKRPRVIPGSDSSSPEIRPQAALAAPSPSNAPPADAVVLCHRYRAPVPASAAPPPSASPPPVAIKPDPDIPAPSCRRDSSPPHNKPLAALPRAVPSHQSLTTDPSLFLPDLTAFLAAADPSLTLLAQPLLDAGVASSRYLALFALLEPDSRMAMYEEMQDSTGVELDIEQIARLEQALDKLRVQEVQA
ncbi:hypothetical protein JCM6882_003260 [Rhodosporidiobolus microsporus]